MGLAIEDDLSFTCNNIVAFVYKLWVYVRAGFDR